MSTADFISLLTQLTYGCLAIVTLGRWIAVRDRSAFRIALFFVLLAVAILAQRLQAALPSLAGLMGLVLFVCLLALPLAATRMVKNFFPLPRPMSEGAVVGYVLALVSLFLAQVALAPVLVYLLVYFCGLGVATVVSFARGAGRTRGIVRLRLWLIAISLLCFVLVFTISFSRPLLSDVVRLGSGQEVALGLVIQIIGLVSALGFLVGFVPPPFLRNYWNLTELGRFLTSTFESVEESADRSFENIGSALSRSFGISEYLVWRASGTVELEHVPRASTEIFANAESRVAAAANGNAPVLFELSRIDEPELMRWCDELGALAVYVLPIRGQVRAWAAVVAAVPYIPFFSREEVSLLSRICQLAGLRIDRDVNLGALRGQKRLLELAVAERTLQLSQANERLARSEGFLRETSRVAQVGGWEFLLPEKTIRLTEESIQILGTDPAQRQPRQLSMEEFLIFFPPEKQDEVRAYFEQPADADQGLDHTLPFGDETGQRKWLRVLGTRELQEGGQTRIYGTLQDVTKIQNVTQELLVVNAKLKQNNRELEDFAYVASHDLQEPLRKIQAFGDRLRSTADDKLDEKSLDYLQRMQNAAGRMQSLINDLLSYSRVTSKAAPFLQVDLSKSAKDALSNLEHRIESSGGRVDIGSLPTIEADAMQMKQLFQNLLGNSLKFHREGVPPVVRVEAQIEDGTCVLRVSDNGIGFENQYVAKLFTPFQRLHGRNAYEGTGIGLAIVRKIVDRHHGAVSALGTPGVGSVFEVRLPASQESVLAKNPPEQWRGADENR